MPPTNYSVDQRIHRASTRLAPLYAPGIVRASMLEEKNGARRARKGESQPEREPLAPSTPARHPSLRDFMTSPRNIPGHIISCYLRGCAQLFGISRNEEMRNEGREGERDEGWKGVCCFARSLEISGGCVEVEGTVLCSE